MANQIMRSNFWPVAAYATMATWLVVINHTHLGMDFHFGADDFMALAQLDSVAHFATALALATTFTQVFGRRWTLARLLLTVVLWEIFEVIVLAVFLPDAFVQPNRRGLVDSVYLFDTLDDLALGFAGALIGCYFGPDEASNTTGSLRKSMEPRKGPDIKVDRCPSCGGVREVFPDGSGSYCGAEDRTWRYA